MRHDVRGLALVAQEVDGRRRPRPSREPSDRPRTAAPTTPVQNTLDRWAGARPCSFTAATRSRSGLGELLAAARRGRAAAPTVSSWAMTSSSVCGSSDTTLVRRRPELARASCTWPARHRAHPAQVLREDDIGLLSPEPVGVQHVERLLGVHAFAHRCVDLARTQRPALGERAAGDHRLRHRVGRVVALVGDPDQRIAETEGVHDLGGRRQQGHDLHAGKSPRARRFSRRLTRSVRARPAVAPSSTRWSNVQLRRAGRPGNDLAVHDERSRPDHADRQGDAGPGRQDRGARLAAVAARVADGDGRPGHLGGRERSRAGALGEALDLRGEVGDATARGVAQHRRRSALVRCRRRGRR